MTTKILLFLLVLITGIGFYYVYEKVNDLVRLLGLLRTEMRQYLCQDESPYWSYPLHIYMTLSALVEVTPGAEEALDHMWSVKARSRTETEKAWMEAEKERERYAAKEKENK